MKVTLAAPWTDPKGRTHKADKSVDVENAVGRNLIYRGLARRVAAVSTKSETTTAVSPVEEEPKP